MHHLPAVTIYNKGSGAGGVGWGGRRRRGCRAGVQFGQELEGMVMGGEGPGDSAKRNKRTLLLWETDEVVKLLLGF